MARQLSTRISSIIIAATTALVGAGIATAIAAAPAVASHAVAGGDNTPWG